MNPRSEKPRFSGGAAPITAGRATAAVRTALTSWYFWPKPLRLPWPENPNPKSGSSSLHRSSSSELPPCTARPDLSTNHTPNFFWFFFGQPRVQPWPETPSPTATLTVALGRNCYCLKWPAWHPLPGRGSGGGSKTGRIAVDLGRSRRRRAGQVSAMEGQRFARGPLTLLQ